MFTNEGDQCLRSSRQTSVTPVNQSQLSPDIHAFDGQEFYFAGLDVVARKTLADERYASIRRNEALDHADARKFHRNVDARAVGAEQFVENLAGVACLRKNQRLTGDLFQGNFRAMRQRISRTDHEA